MFVRFQTVGKVTWSVLTGFSSLPGDPAPADPAPTALLALGLTLPTNQPPPPGAFGNFWTHFWLSQLGAGECFWHLVGRDQGCSEAPLGARGSGPTKHNYLIIWPKMSTAPGLGAPPQGSFWARRCVPPGPGTPGAHPVTAAGSTSGCNSHSFVLKYSWGTLSGNENKMLSSTKGGE